MNPRDLEIAKRLLFEKKLTLCIVKNGNIVFESRTQGIAPLVEAVEEFKPRLEGSSAADKVVGKPVALLCVYARLEAIYADMMSVEAVELLKKCSIHFEYDLLVERILRADRKGICPFDRLMRGVTDPVDAYRKLKNACSSK
jgi:hypothetical protein